MEFSTYRIFKSAIGIIIVDLFSIFIYIVILSNIIGTSLDRIGAKIFDITTSIYIILSLIFFVCSALRLTAILYLTYDMLFCKVVSVEGYFHAKNHVYSKDIFNYVNDIRFRSRSLFYRYKVELPEKTVKLRALPVYSKYKGRYVRVYYGELSNVIVKIENKTQ